MLSALQTVNPEEATDILAHMTRRWLPSAFLSSGQERRNVDVERAIERELRSTLQLRPDDQTVEAQAAMASALGDEIRRLLLPPDRTTVTIESMGQRGRVPTSFYETVEPTAFLSTFRQLGLRKGVANEAVHRPHFYEHLWPDYTGIKNNTQVISLFVRRHGGSDAVKPHYRLLQTHRMGITQIAQSYWFIFDEIAERVDTLTPLQLLKVFANEYGMEVTIGGGHRSKFIDAIDIDVGGRNSIAFQFMQNPDGNYFASFSMAVAEDGLNVRAGAAFAIDLVKYKSALVRHKVIR